MQKRNLVHQTYRAAKEKNLTATQKKDLRLIGAPLRNHLIKHICRIMTEYAPEVGVLKKEIADDLKAIKAWKLDAITDWFYVYDALGSNGNLDAELTDFYMYAASRWWYNQLALLPKRRKKITR
jgi:hypothetical protein